MSSKKLPGDYLDYPKRDYGQDQDRYDWQATPGSDEPRDATQPSIALIIPLERFVLNPSGTPYRAPGAMVTHYPDLRHFTSRDYGNRIGVYRLLKILGTLKISATFAINAELLANIRPLIDRIQTDGHEIAALGLDMENIHWGGLDPETEAQWVEKTRALFSEAKLHPKTWMSPARQQSEITLDLIAANGFDACLDWEFDCAPKPMRTKNGTITMVPNLNELDDRKLLIEKKHSEQEWAEQLIEAAAYSKTISTKNSPQSFAITLTPYISGLPFRIRCVRDTLQQLKEMVDFKTVQSIL